MSPSRVPKDATRGFIVPIGGAEERTTGETILRRFVRLCGGRSARIAVIPTASESSSTGRDYEKLFRDLRADKVWVLPFETRKQCEDAEELAVLEKANGVFLTGGNQLRLSTALGGTSVAKFRFRSTVLQVVFGHSGFLAGAWRLATRDVRHEAQLP